MIYDVVMGRKLCYVIRSLVAVAVAVAMPMPMPMPLMPISTNISDTDRSHMSWTGFTIID